MEKLYQIVIVLALIFIAIGSPIATILSLTGGVEVSFIVLLVSLIELVIFLVVLMDKLLTKILSVKYRERMKEVQKVVNILIVIVAICFLPGVWSMSEEGGKGHTYDYDSDYSDYVDREFNMTSKGANSGYEKHQKTKNQCQYMGCERVLTDETDSYCYYHECKKMDCKLERYGGTEYCQMHGDEEEKQRAYKSDRSSSNKSEEDQYGVNDYAGPEDFYEDNYDDFEGFEDAEDYYDEYAD